MMLSGTGCIQACDIEKKIDKIEGKYVILWDQALVTFKHDHVNRAINFMAEKGWRCINIAVTEVRGSCYGYALMERGP